ncbi:Na+/H+ antiporter subunit D, partial [Lutimaribacter sp. EGI FJ00014]|nr:Na+/H+ antiporter subunit D [Lutimaribacter sp. EGI FJ00014]
YSLSKLSGLYATNPLVAAFALLLILAAAGLPPASGLWPKVMLVRASLDSGQPWLAFAILATGLLTTLALGRVFILAIWRPRVAAGPKVPASPLLGYVALTALSLPVVVMGLYPDPIIAVAERAADAILNAPAYIGTVFPEGAAQ